MNKCGLVSPHSSQPGYPWFAVLKQQVINPETGHKLPKIFHGGTIVSKKFIVTAAEIFYTDDTELEEAWKQPDAWQVIPAFETGYKNIKRYDPDPDDGNMFKWINVISIDIHPEYCDGSHDCAKSIRYAESVEEKKIN